MSAARLAAPFALVSLALLLGSLGASVRAAPPERQTVAIEDVYSAGVRSRIGAQRALLRPFYLSGGHVVLGLEIDRHGQLINGAILASSGLSELDRAAARMATFAAPFAAPPAELTGDPVAVKVVLKLPASKAAWDDWLAGAPEPPAW